MVKKILKIGILVIVLIAGFWHFFGGIQHSTPNSPPEQIVTSGDPILDSIKRAENFLKSYQEANGFFAKGILAPRPAFTCLVVDAMLSSPSSLSENDPIIKKAIEAILSTKQEDGGFYGKSLVSLGNYSTSLAIMVLHRADKNKYQDIIQKAATFVKGNQLTGMEYQGGFGYVNDASKADMSNTTLSLESLKLSGNLDEKTKENAIKFIEKCQNNSETNSLPWASNDKGFIYRPGNSKAGTYDEGGKTRYRSYGLMTYAGILSMIYADLSKDDPRVQGSIEWISKNFSLDDNINLGAKGLYYYYVTMAKALDALGDEKILTENGSIHFWAKELADKIVSLQHEDGSFVNDKSAEWLENDRVLVTAYMLKALSICYQNIKTNAK